MASERHPGDFGNRLREARERRGLSLREISKATKISTTVLEALEHNDFSRLPGGIFSRAFVRSYAQQVGLDAERTLREFAELVPPATSAVVPLTPTNVEDNERVESERRMASALVRLLAVSVPIAGVVLYFASAGLPGEDPAAEADARSSAGLVEAPPPAATAGPDAARVPAPAPVDQAVEPPPVASAAGRLVVTLEAVAPCWVSSTVDGERTVARLLQPGERRTIEVGKELVLTAGDAAALRLTLNGAAARPLGSPGEVVTRRISPANFTDYLPR